MHRLRVVAAICVLLVLVGSSIAFTPVDDSDSLLDTPRQTSGQDGSNEVPDVQIIPKEDLILRDQSTTFVVRIEDADDSDGILICVDNRINRPTRTEFHSKDVVPFDLPASLGFGCAGSDESRYLPARAVDTVESIPVSIAPSPTRKLPIGTNRVDIETKFKNPSLTVSEAFTFEVACHISCRLSLLWRTIVRRAGLIVAILSLLLAFFGRKRIWAALRFPRERVTGLGGGEQRQDMEAGRGESRRDE